MHNSKIYLTFATANKKKYKAKKMKVRQILEYENAVDRSKDTIILIKDGEWWRAYEWSAYLLYNLIDDEQKRLKPIRKDCSLVDSGFIMVAFKTSSANKYLEDKEASLDIQKDVIYIKVDGYDLTDDESDKILSEWKLKFELTSEPKKNKKPSDVQSFSMETVIKTIQKFNIERATLLEDAAFVSKLKYMVNNICP